MQTIGQYQIDIYTDGTFDQGSADNLNKYDYEYLEGTEYQLPTKFGIKIFEEGYLIKSAIIGSQGGETGIHERSVIYEDNRIVVRCSNTVFCLLIPDLKLLWKVQADPVTCFEIYKYKDDYIIHGELEISRIDKDGKILWQRSGSDIFLTLNGDQDFELTEKFIIAKDFKNRVYRFDYNGNNFIDINQNKTPHDGLYKTVIVFSYLFCGLSSAWLLYARSDFWTPGFLFISLTVVIAAICNSSVRLTSIVKYIVLSYFVYLAVFLLTFQCGSAGLITGIFLCGAGAYIVFWLTNKFIAEVNYKTFWMVLLGGLSFLANVLLLLEPVTNFIKPVYDIAREAKHGTTFDFNIRFAPSFLFWQFSVGTKLGLEIFKSRTGSTALSVNE